MDNRSRRVKAACPLLSDKIIDRAMKKPDPAPKDERAERLAQALRANLHRRKAQARAIDGKADDPGKAGQ
jgi:hypothetical protein